MASLIDNYEQQYAVLTADITAKIGRIRTQSGSKYEKSGIIETVLSQGTDCYFQSERCLSSDIIKQQ